MLRLFILTVWGGGCFTHSISWRWIDAPVSATLLWHEVLRGTTMIRELVTRLLHIPLFGLKIKVRGMTLVWAYITVGIKISKKNWISSKFGRLDHNLFTTVSSGFLLLLYPHKQSQLYWVVDLWRKMWLSYP